MAGVRKEGILLVDDVGDSGGVPVEIGGPLGSQVAADSVSVAIASDQLPLPITGTIEVEVTDVDQGDPNTLANAWPVKLTDGVEAVDVLTITDADGASVNGLVTNSLIYGESSAGGGSYERVKVNPSGSLLVEANQGTPAAVADAWPIKVTDGAQTANVNNDGQLDVAAWPPTDQTANGTISAINEFVSIPNISGYNSVTVEIPAGATLVGTLKFAIGLAPDVINYVYAFDTLNNKWVDSITDVSILNTWRIPGVSGYDIFVICTDYTSGSVDVFLSVTTAIINNPGLTEEELRSTPIETEIIDNSVIRVVSGTINIANTGENVAITDLTGIKSIFVRLRGGSLGQTPGVDLEVYDGATWNPIDCLVINASGSNSNYSVLSNVSFTNSATLSPIYHVLVPIDPTVHQQFRVIDDAGAASSTIFVEMVASPSTSLIDTMLANPRTDPVVSISDTIGNYMMPFTGAFGMMYNGSSWDRIRGTSALGLTVNTELPAAAALADATSNPTVPIVGAFGGMYNGSSWDRMRGDATNGLLTTLGVPTFANGSLNSVTTASHTLNGNFNTITLAVSGGTFIGTVNIEHVDGGNVISANMLDITTRKWVTGPFTNLSSGFYFIPIAGIASIRINITAYTSGAFTYNIRTFTSNTPIYGLTNEELRAAPVDISIQKAGTATQTQVPDSATSVTILAANTDRLGATVVNTSTVTLYLRLSSSAATTDNYTVVLVAGAYYEVPYWYNGQITGIWASDPGTGNANVTELTA